MSLRGCPGFFIFMANYPNTTGGLKGSALNTPKVRGYVKRDGKAVKKNRKKKVR